MSDDAPSLIAERVREREISRVVHFTTNRGVLGMIATNALLPRAVLPRETYLEYVYKPNADYRKDPAWTGYNSLSITKINTEFFGFARNWHNRDGDLWWAVIVFDPVILTHDGVVFVTTNNIYPAAERASGASGFEALFADPVLGRYGTEHRRAPGMAENLTTDVQAEVLYPEALSIEHACGIYVSEHEHVDIVTSQLQLFASSGKGSNARPDLVVDVDQDAFL